MRDIERITTLALDLTTAFLSYYFSYDDHFLNYLLSFLLHVIIVFLDY